MSNESAELLQVGAAQPVTARGWYELTHAHTAADGRLRLCHLSLLCAVHAALTFASCVVCMAMLQAVLWPEFAAACATVEAHRHLPPRILMHVKGAISIFAGRAERNDRTHALAVAFSPCHGN